MKKKSIVLIFIFIIVFLTSCGTIKSEAIFKSSNTRFFIWDPERILVNYPSLTNGLHDVFPEMLILSGNLPEDAAAILGREFSRVPEDSLCIFLLISGRTAFQLSSEWNLWFPEIWRSTDCRGRVLIADAPWGDEFLNPVKTKKENTVWVIDGRLGQLRRKLDGAFAAASCRFDEANLLSRGIDGKTKTPLYSWYFLDLLLGSLNTDNEADIVTLLEDAKELTVSAHSRGVASDLEEVLFFNRSQVQRKEFRTFPNPVIWNGLADKIIIRKEE